MFSVCRLFVLTPNDQNRYFYLILQFVFFKPQHGTSGRVVSSLTVVTGSIKESTYVMNLLSSKRIMLVLSIVWPVDGSAKLC